MIYVLIVATMNLLLGYVLGAHFGWLPSIVRSWLPLPPLLAEIDEPLPTAAPRAKSPTPQPVRESAEESVTAEKAEPTEPAHQADPDVTPESRLSDRLALFRQRLKSLRTEMDAAEGDGEKLDQCAADMKQEGEQYISETSEDVAEMAKTPEGIELSEAVEQSNEDIKITNEELDKVAAAESAEDKLKLLRESSDKLEESAKSVEETVTDANGQAEQSEIEHPNVAASSLSSLDQVEKLIDDYFSEGDSGAQPLQVAAVKIDQLPDDPSVDRDRLLNAISRIVNECLKDGQRAAAREVDEVLLTLAGDGPVEATDRLEEIRKRVEATEFLSKGKTHTLTVSCGFADTNGFESTNLLLTGLSDTLEEAARYGRNRTLNHDGRMSAPVAPGTMSVESATIEI